MTKFYLIKKEVEGILPNSPLDFELKHAKLVLRLVLDLKPDADEALKIAALSHDIDRAITKITEKDLKDYSKISEFKKEHSIRSAKFICDILKKYDYSADIIAKVKHLVENHESGGDEETDILTDADSLAYFGHSVPSYLKRNGREKAKGKIKFMYKRMSANAKKLFSQIKFEDPKIAQLVQEAISDCR